MDRPQSSRMRPSSRLRYLGLLAAFFSVAAIPKPQDAQPVEPESPAELSKAAPTQPKPVGKGARVGKGTERSLPETMPNGETTANGETAPSRASSAIETINIKLSGKRIHLLASGEPESPTVLLLHGARFSAETWRQLGTLELLGRQGYRALALNLPGFGDSETSETPRDRVLASLLPLLTDRPVVVISPSMSGAFSFPLITRRPSYVAGFVPVAPGAISSHLTELQGSRVPTLIFWGEKDAIIPVKQGEQLNRAMANSRLVVLEDAQHPCYLDKPLDFHRELLQFLRSLSF